MISFELPEDLITALTTTPNLFAQTNGNPLPVWLEYNETKGQFRIAEPATISSLPYEVVANLDQSRVLVRICLLYTSDAADERSSVDLGGRRIIKKKNK